MTGKVVLAYSGGLDTSIIIPWLVENHGLEVHCLAGDVGQGDDELQGLEQKALDTGAASCRIVDLRREFLVDYVWPCLRAMAIYEGRYLLGTSMARPVLAKAQVDYAQELGASHLAHGCTGKGNDQVRFELAYYALDPEIRVIAPWRVWDLDSRARLIDYAEKHQIPIAKDSRGEAPYSIDANLLHVSYEGKALEDPWVKPDPAMFTRTVAPEAAPDRPTQVEIDFAAGDAVAVDGEPLTPAALLTRLNALGGANGIGRVDLVENRCVGMKSRGVYETPGGSILLAAHRAVESITLDREAGHLKDELMPRYAGLIYNGLWFSPERRMLQAAIDESQRRVNGTVRLELYKGAVQVVGRKSDHSLYSQAHVTFEADQVYDQSDAEGFIKLNALRLRLAKMRGG